MKIYAYNKDNGNTYEYDEFKEFICDNLTEDDIMI